MEYGANSACFNDSHSLSHNVWHRIRSRAQRRSKLNLALYTFQIDLPLNYDITTKRNYFSSQHLSEISNQASSHQQHQTPKKVSFKVSEDDEGGSSSNKKGGLATIIESTSEDYTTDSNFMEDSSDRENQQIKQIETETDIFSKHKENKIISYTDFMLN